VIASAYDELAVASSHAILLLPRAGGKERKKGRKEGLDLEWPRHVPRLERRCAFMHRFCMGAKGEGKK